MIHVFIDSTVLRQDPRREKAAFQVVTRLAKESKVTLHLSEVTCREYLSKQNSFCANNVRKVESGLNGLIRQPLEDGLRSAIGSFRDRLLSSSKFIDADFAKWVKETKATVHPVHDAHGKRVMDAYFEGGPPFRGPKARDDIPDAFIWQCLSDVTSTVDTLHFVTSDVNFADACKQQTRLVIHTSLTGFVTSSAILDLLPHTPNVTAFLYKLSEQRVRVAEHLEIALIDRLCDGIWDFESEGFGNEVFITGAGAPENLEIDVDNSDDLGEGQILIPFTADVDCMLQFYMPISEYYQLPVEVFKRLSASEHNDHVMEIEEDGCTVHVQGTLMIEADAKLLAAGLENDATVDTLLSNISITIDELDEVRPEPPDWNEY